jgi:DNA topoisomerase-3
MQKLLSTGRTDLMTAFVSKKGRKFKAFLAKTPGGKIGFEFLPRAEKPAKAAKASPEEKPPAPAKPPAKKAAAKKTEAKKPAKRRKAA